MTGEEGIDVKGGAEDKAGKTRLPSDLKAVLIVRACGAGAGTGPSIREGCD